MKSPPLLPDPDEPKQPPKSNGRIVQLDPPIQGYSEIEFSKHAIEQMSIRGITQDEAIRTVRKPRETGLPTQIMRHRVRSYRGAGVAVDVVYEFDYKRIIVITAIVIQRK